MFLLELCTRPTYNLNSSSFSSIFLCWSFWLRLSNVDGESENLQSYCQMLRNMVSNPCRMIMPYRQSLTIQLINLHYVTNIMPSPWVFLRLVVNISMPGPSLTWGGINMSWRPPRIRTINMSRRPSWVRTWGWTLQRVEVLPAEVQVLPDGKNLIFYWSHWAGSMVSLHMYLIMSWKFSLLANIRPDFSDHTVIEQLVDGSTTCALYGNFGKM